MKNAIKSILFVGTFSALIFGPVGAQVSVSDNPAMLEAAQSITAEDYFRRISVIAHDSMGGRDTPSPGLDATADWIASEFKSFGLRPGGDDGSFIQTYGIETIRVDLVSSAVQVNGAGDLRFGRDILPAGRGFVEGDFTGPVTLVSGVEGDVESHSAEITGRHVIYTPQGSPEGGGRQVFNVIRTLGAMGSLSVTIVSGGDDAEWTRAREAVTGRSSVRVSFRDPGSPLFSVRPSAIQPILEAHGVAMPAVGSGVDLIFAQVPDLELTFSPRLEVVESRSAPNVVGILEGSDPVLKDEYLVYSAHMDHVGTGSADDDGDSIFNGADDDASGTTGIIELAEAFSSMETAPRRSIIFLLVSGEEKGLWGSDFFAGNPGVPIEDIVANVNADMIGRNWPDTIVAIGKEHSDLGETMNQVNDAHPELNMTAIDDIWPEERFYFRSDHFNFARRGVPILFFFNGTHPDYHRRNDEVDRIDSEKAMRITRLMFYLGWEISNRDARPRWNPESRQRIVTDMP
jgi:Peptidase family M28